MRISRRRKKPEEPKKVFFYNESITAPQVLVLGPEGENIGVLNTAEAIRQAREMEMDLVQINPKVDPPVVKIMDFGQYQYQQEKQARLRKAHQHVAKTKCIKISLRIGKHDLDIRHRQTIDFLEDGNKVKIMVVLRGRENQQNALAFDLLDNFIKAIAEKMLIKFDQEKERQGNMVTAIIYKS